jgi:hypothetical protein
MSKPRGFPRVAAFLAKSSKKSERGNFSLDQTRPLSRFRLPDDERGSKNEAKIHIRTVCGPPAAKTADRRQRRNKSEREASKE